MNRLYVTAALAVLSQPAVAQDYLATTNTNAVIRQAPGPTYTQIGVLPAGTSVAVDVCFSKGAYCQVSWTGEPSSGFVAGELLTIDQSAQTVLAAEQEKWTQLANRPSKLPDFQDIRRVGIHTEGDSYMAGAYQVSLTKMIAAATGRPVVNTAKGASEMAAVRDRILAPANGGLLKDLTIIWDGSNNGMTSPAAYADDLEDAIKATGHGRFVVIPAMHGTNVDQVAAEFKARWPENVLDWRDVLSTYQGQIPPQYLADPEKDRVHLNEAALSQMAQAVVAFIREKHW